MNIGMRFRDAIRGVSFWVEQEFDGLIAGIAAHWNIEHNPEGTHAAITASSLTLPAGATIQIGDVILQESGGELIVTDAAGNQTTLS